MNTTTPPSHSLWQVMWASCLLIVFIVWCGVARAEEQTSRTYVPARFGTGSDSLLGQLKCPEKRGPRQRVVLFCQAHVGADGLIANRGSRKSSGCIGTGLTGNGDGEKLLNNSQKYVSAMSRALKTARFLPAEVDGVAVPVYFPFQVVFEDKDGCVATAFPNLGDQASELGGGYVAPQEILSDGGWVKRMKFIDPFEFPLPGVFFSMSVLVDENGNATDHRVEYTNPVTRTRNVRSPATMAGEAAAALERSKFIPGFYQGAPRPTRYLEIFFVQSAPSGSFEMRIPGAADRGF